MTEAEFYSILLRVFGLLAALTFPVLFFVTAPYGRHEGKAWGPTLPNRLGWLLMESPSVLVFGACWILGGAPTDLVSLTFLGLWQLHYVHRAWVFPFRLRTDGKRMPLLIAASSFSFTTVNGYLNGRWLFGLGAGDYAGWASDPRFVAGALIFLLGFAINQHADYVLLHLRRPGETGYRIPHGGLYRWVSCPNYLGEMVEWLGFALCTWSWPGLVFALWTIANLLPRALSNHRWYQERFPDYPPRKALIPGLL